MVLWPNATVVRLSLATTDYPEISPFHQKSDEGACKPKNSQDVPLEIAVQSFGESENPSNIRNIITRQSRIDPL